LALHLDWSSLAPWASSQAAWSAQQLDRRSLQVGEFAVVATTGATAAISAIEPGFHGCAEPAELFLCRAGLHAAALV
jgi:hypothetical protein